jgi:hypothetical protein
MLTLLELRLEGLRQRINQKLPQATESVLEQVWTILNVAKNCMLTSSVGKLLVMKMNFLVQIND